MTTDQQWKLLSRHELHDNTKCFLFDVQHSVAPMYDIEDCWHTFNPDTGKQRHFANKQFLASWSRKLDRHFSILLHIFRIEDNAKPSSTNALLQIITVCNKRT